MRLSLLAALALSAALSPVFSAEAREIAGAVTYHQRIALDPDAHLLVELHDATGTLVAELREEAGGRQVPLPFAFAATPDTAYTLRGALILGGAAHWLSEPVAIEPGGDPLDLGEILLSRHRALSFAAPFRCGDARIGIGFAGDRARLRTPAGLRELAPTPAASGARYADPADDTTWVWSRGNMVAVALDGEELGECLPGIDPGLLPLDARGQEPGWMLTLDSARAVYTGNYGETRLEAPMVAPDPVADGGLRLAFDGFALTLHEALCRDTMTGMPYPLTAGIETGGIETGGEGTGEDSLAGCAGDPATLLAGEWRLTGLGGDPMPEEGAAATLRFTAEGRVSGRAACNWFAGGYDLTGEGLRLSPMGATMMACAGPAMDLDQRIFAAFETVDRFDIGTDGALLLIGADRTVLRAEPAGGE
ncbi:MAG: META domain-containing protein [Gemmobacter sp.]